MPSSTSIPIIVQGNTFSLAIPLQIYVISGSSMVLQDYTPDPTDEVSIQLKGDRRQYTYTPTITDNIATIDLSGNELADNYAVVVSIVKANGQRLRSFRTDQFFIVESSDDLTMDDIIAGLEENVIYLNAQAFISLGEVVISDSTTTFDAESALSAKQGAILRENIELLLSSLGEYAFPDGKPTLDWSGGTLAVTLNLTDFSSSNMAETTQRGSAYTTTLTPAHSSNLYVNEVVIMMGDEDITATAYNALTGVVSIAEVTGAIEITASQETYVQDGLVLHLDGMNRGGTSGSWKDLVNTSRALAFTGGYTENSDNMQLDGTGYGIGDFVDDVLYSSSTAECVINQANKTSPSSQVILLEGKTGAPILALFANAQQSNKICWSSWAKSASDTYSATRSIYEFNGNIDTKYSISYYGNKMARNGNQLTALVENNTFEDAFNVTNHLNKTAVGAQKTGGGSILGFNGKIFAIRLYNRVLTDAEVQHNWKVDQKRFNIS